MKFTIGTTLLACALTMVALPVIADTCSTGCNIQTKKASATKKGEFDYQLSCIRDSSGDELIAKVTAATDAAAKALGIKQC